MSPEAENLEPEEAAPSETDPLAAQIARAVENGVERVARAFAEMATEQTGEFFNQFATKEEVEALAERLDESAQQSTPPPAPSATSGEATPPDDVDAGDAFDMVEIDYSTTTHILRYRVRQPTVDANGNLTFSEFGSWTTIDTAVP
jgi:hypothetical protein